MILQTGWLIYVSVGVCAAFLAGGESIYRCEPAFAMYAIWGFGKREGNWYRARWI